jgi:hypothetical protein
MEVPSPLFAISRKSEFYTDLPATVGKPDFAKRPYNPASVESLHPKSRNSAGFRNRYAKFRNTEFRLIPPNFLTIVLHTDRTYKI